MDETAEDAAAHGNPFTPTSLSELANSEVTNAFRMAAEALSRMLWAGMSDVAANQGLCVPLANLLLSDHPETQHAAALAVCNLVRSPEASIIAASDGVIGACSFFTLHLRSLFLPLHPFTITALSPLSFGFDQLPSSAWCCRALQAHRQCPSLPWHSTTLPASNMAARRCCH